MAKDYKNAAKKKPDNNPGLFRNMLPFITGLVLGLLTTFILYLGQQNGSYLPFQTKNEPATVTPVAPPPTETPVVQKKEVPKPSATEDSAVQTPKFDFYNILPNKELNVSEWVAEEQALEEPGTLDTNSVYILQVGSFKQVEAADQVKAQLTLLGVTADIQRVVINGQDAIYRVRVGPYADQQKLNDARLRLQQNNLEFMLLKLQADDPRLK